MSFGPGLVLPDLVDEINAAFANAAGTGLPVLLGGTVQRCNNLMASAGSTGHTLVRTGPFTTRGETTLVKTDPITDSPEWTALGVAPKFSITPGGVIGIEDRVAAENAIAYGTIDAADVWVTARVRCYQEMGLQSFPWAARFDSINTFVGARARNNTVELWQRDSGAFTPLDISEKPCDYGNTVRLELRGDQVTLFIDTARYGPYTTTVTDPGRVGIIDRAHSDPLPVDVSDSFSAGLMPA